MSLRNITRIAALAAAIMLCMALALGACMAKRSRVNNPSSVSNENSPGTTSSSMRNRSGGSKGPSDTDSETTPKPEKPNPATPKGSKGMVGQMHLEGGE